MIESVGLLYDFFLMPLEWLGLSRIRKRLLAHAHGKILEIGVGTGLNLPHYPTQINKNVQKKMCVEPDPRLQDTETDLRQEILGIEPNSSLRRRAQKRTRRLLAAGTKRLLAVGTAPFPADKTAQLPIQILEGDAEALPFADATFDTVVGTLVLCSIAHPELALAEACRVLKPGGRLLLLEHVRHSHRASIGRLQDVLAPAWKIASGGCHLNRNPAPLFKPAGFKILHEETLWGSLGKIWILEKINSTH